MANALNLFTKACHKCYKLKAYETLQKFLKPTQLLAEIVFKNDPVKLYNSYQQTAFLIPGLKSVLEFLLNMGEEIMKS